MQKQWNEEILEKIVKSADSASPCLFSPTMQPLTESVFSAQFEVYRDDLDPDYEEEISDYYMDNPTERIHSDVILYNPTKISYQGIELFVSAFAIPIEDEEFDYGVSLYASMGSEKMNTFEEMLVVLFDYESLFVQHYCQKMEGIAATPDHLSEFTDSAEEYVPSYGERLVKQVFGDISTISGHTVIDAMIDLYFNNYIPIEHEKPQTNEVLFSVVK